MKSGRTNVGRRSLIYAGNSSITSNASYGHFSPYQDLNLGKMREKTWFTTNAEYGRFLKEVFGKQSESRKRISSHQSVQNVVPETEVQSETKSEPLDTLGRLSVKRPGAGVKLPPIQPKYMSGKPRPPYTFPQDAEPKELPKGRATHPPTTGYAKKYMQTSCSRFWNNLTGADVESRRQSLLDGTSHVQVLKIDNESETKPSSGQPRGEFDESHCRDDDARSHSIPSQSSSRSSSASSGDSQLRKVMDESP